LNPDPKMEKNYIIALVLSMLVLLLYPLLFQKTTAIPPNEATENIQTEAEKTFSIEHNSVMEKALSAPEGPFLEKTTPPSIIRFENNQYEIDFSTLGASITRLIYKGESGRDEISKNMLYEGDPSQPGLFGIRLLHDQADLHRTVFKLHRSGEPRNQFEFFYEKAGEYRVVKQFVIGEQEPTLQLTVTLENLTNRQRHLPLEITYALHADQTTLQSNQPHEFEVLAWTNKVESADFRKVNKKGFLISKEIDWAGVVKKYYALLIKPDVKGIAQNAKAEENVLWGALRLAPMSLEPGAKDTRRFFVYAGPQRYEMLKHYDVGFEQILSRGFFGVFKIWLLIGLKFSHRFTHNFGWDIILLTFLIKGLFAPLTHISYQSMEKMKVVQPKLKAIQEKYKKNPEKLNKEMMELYRKHKVNPMAGCLPMLYNG